MENNDIAVFEKEYIRGCVRFGRVTNLLSVLVIMLPPLLLLGVFGLWPGWGPILAGLIMQVSVIGVFWVVEPVSYFNVLGIPGTYMAFLSGNIANLRMPVSVAAQGAAGVEPGSEQGTVIATIGCAVSVIVNVVLVTIGVMLGSQVLGMLPPKATLVLNNILPALFAALFAQQVIARPKIGLVAAILITVMLLLLHNGLLSFLPGNPVYAVVIVSVFGSILIGRKLYEKDLAAKS